jgi:hypothetical protein
MTPRRTPISYRFIGHTEIWVDRMAPSQVDVTTYDHIDRTETVHSFATLDDAMTQVSAAITRELRRQQGDSV